MGPFFRFGPSHSQTFTVTLVQTNGPKSLHLFFLPNQNFLGISVKVLCKKKWELYLKKTEKNSQVSFQTRKRRNFDSCISVDEIKEATIVGVESKR